MKAKAAAMPKRSKKDNEKVAKNPAESGSFGGSYLALLIGAVSVGLRVAHLQT